MAFLHHSHLSFNSNMVRLKDGTPTKMHRYSTFQFQYGSIKRVYSFCSRARRYPFQFQYGSIKSFPFSHQLSGLIVFQFQYGSIKST